MRTRLGDQLRFSCLRPPSASATVNSRRLSMSPRFKRCVSHVKNKLILISLVVAGACVASVCAFLYFEAAIAFFDRINMSWFGVKAATGGAFRVYAVAVVAGSISGAYLAIAFGARIARHPDRTVDAGAILASFVVAALIVAFAVVTAGDAAGSAIDYFGWPFLVALFGYVGLVVWLKHITAGTSEPGGMSR